MADAALCPYLWFWAEFSEILPKTFSMEFRYGILNSGSNRSSALFQAQHVRFSGYFPTRA